MTRSQVITAVNNWKADKKLTKKAAWCFVEIYRRVKQFHHDNYDARSVMLAYPSEVTGIKQFLVVTHEPETPKVLNWYNLTAEGQELTKTLEAYLPWDDKLNEVLYDLN